MTTTNAVQLYEDQADELMSSDMFPDRVSLLPGEKVKLNDPSASQIRILWGQGMLRDLLNGRYRVMVCGVNDEDNSHGIIAQLVDLMPTSQWSAAAVTSYAKMFHDSVAIHASGDREPYILKFDLDNLLILALLRPKGQDYFTLKDLGRGFMTVTKMLHNRRERLPVATVSFLGARSNRLVNADGSEPSFECVLRTMHEAGYCGDIYPSPQMWRVGQVGVFPSYPFPAGLDRMRQGSS